MYSVLQYVAVCCSVLQCVAVCCSVLQCVAVGIAGQSRTQCYCCIHYSNSHTFHTFLDRYGGAITYTKLLLHALLTLAYILYIIAPPYLSRKVWRSNRVQNMIIAYIPQTRIHSIHYCCSYGVATISRLLKMTGLFCKRAL